MYSRVCLGGAHPVGFDKRIKTRSHRYCITQSSFAVVMCYNSHRKLKQSRSADWKGAMRQGTGPGPTNPPNAPGLAFRHSFALHPTGALIPALPEPAVSLPVASESHNHCPRCRLSMEVGQSWFLVLVTGGLCHFPSKA